MQSTLFDDGQDGSSISDPAFDDADDNTTSGILSRLLGVVLSTLPLITKIFLKHKLEDMKKKDRERRERRKDFDSVASESYYSPKPYLRRRRTRQPEPFCDQQLPPQARSIERNPRDKDRDRERDMRFRGRTRYARGDLPGGSPRTQDWNRYERKNMERRRYSESYIDRRNLRRKSIVKGYKRRSRSSSPRRRSRSRKNHTTVKVTMPFSDQIMHAGAVGIIAGATTAIRLRSSDKDWLGEKGLRAGSASATAAVASLVVDRDSGRDSGRGEEFIRSAALPIIAGLGVDHMLWE
ncbi:hypothetical protein G7Y89_g7830 [Cudoniella acicularis]|uniref:Uncharacterized protein n=1 Tax=Cudoniella acicularis TaxID=354080 RepID=A0A8H4RIK0_9HELO|nr:hypothetical protein G7Y89_g7830 [Cudoniella acicularis]